MGQTAATRPAWADLPGWDGQPETLPPVFPVLVASWVIGIGKNKTYEMIADGEYPIRVIELGGRFRATRYDLLDYLGASRQAREAS